MGNTVGVVRYVAICAPVGTTEGKSFARTSLGCHPKIVHFSHECLPFMWGHQRSEVGARGSALGLVALGVPSWS